MWLKIGRQIWNHEKQYHDEQRVRHLEVCCKASTRHARLVPKVMSSISSLRSILLVKGLPL